MLHGDLLRIEHAGGTSWRLLRSSQGHAPDDDDDDDDDDDEAVRAAVDAVRCNRSCITLYQFQRLLIVLSNETSRGRAYSC